MGAALGGEADETGLCTAAIDKYVQCMSAHEGIRPDPYEPEFCAVERDLYIACRAELKKKKTQSRS
jgi:hypothetical protein